MSSVGFHSFHGKFSLEWEYTNLAVNHASLRGVRVHNDINWSHNWRLLLTFSDPSILFEISQMGKPAGSFTHDHHSHGVRCSTCFLGNISRCFQDAWRVHHAGFMVLGLRSQECHASHNQLAAGLSPAGISFTIHFWFIGLVLGLCVYQYCARAFDSWIISLNLFPT